MRVVPLVGREAGHDEESEADEEIGSEDVEPDLHREGVHEGEETSGLRTWNLV